MCCLNSDICLIYFSDTLLTKNDPHMVSQILRDCNDITKDNTLHKDIFIHSKYNATSFENDIALIRLSKDLKFSLEEHAVCLWSSGMLYVLQLLLWTFS